MAELRLYHNPRCSKSRAAVALLQAHGANVRIVDYLDNPPTAAELVVLLAMLAVPARDLVRSGEPDYAALGLADPATSEDDLIAAMVAHPRLIERPILVSGNRAVIGRPPQRVLELLG